MMIDNMALIDFLSTVYSRTIPTVLSNDEIKQIEKFYNDNHELCDDIKQFYALNRSIARNIKKYKSVKCEIERQFYSKKGLQQGTLCECVMAETIAKMYDLDTFADVFHTYIRELPANILYRLRDDNNQILCRYIYYNKDDLDTFLIQYGNPTRYDADLYLNGNMVKLEFKDRIARAGEKQTEYDNAGKLIYTEKFAYENPDYLPLIERFNENYNLIDLSGNYEIEDREDQIAILKSYFRNLGFETLVTIDDDNNLIAITEDCIDLNDGREFLSLDGSEIRRAGKNGSKVFTKDLLMTSIEKDEGIVDNELVKIPKTNMGDRIFKKKLTGKKINHLFFVPLNKITEDENDYIFSIKDVKQLKPTLSVHMQITADRDQLVRYYREKLESNRGN